MEIVFEQKHGRHIPYSYFGGKHTKEGISAKTQRWKKPRCSRKICAASEAGGQRDSRVRCCQALEVILRPLLFTLIEIVLCKAMSFYLH